MQPRKVTSPKSPTAVGWQVNAESKNNTILDQICYAQLRISKLYYNPRGRVIVRFAMVQLLVATNLSK